MSIRLVCPECGRQLKAPDSAAGKKAHCPNCQKVLDVPDEVVDAETVEPPAAEETYQFQEPADQPIPVVRPAEESGEERRPCPMCGELIRAHAAKCRYCGEIFDPGLRSLERRKQQRAEDSDLSGGEWVLAILCSGIGCICGIIWVIQGKPKGWKMVGVSLLFAVLWNIVSALIRIAIHPQ